MSSKRPSRLRAESLLAAAAALVGVLSLVSALTPEFADRTRFIRSTLPPELPELARLLTLAFGIALLLVSRSLARRRRRAWALALIAVIGVSISHLVKGLDFEEALVSLLLVVALLRYRSRFDVPGDPAARRPVAGGFLATLGATGLVIALDTRGMLPWRLEELIGVAAVILALWALMLWLGPFPEHVRQSIEQRLRARRLVESFGSDSLAFFALRRDKSYHFSSGGEAFLAYRLVGSTALVSGDPVGEEGEIEPLVREFVAYARERGWRVAVVGAGRGRLRLYRELGIGRVIKIGEEAVVRPESFSTEGRAIRKVRQAARKVAERDGVSFRVVEATSVDRNLRSSIEGISSVWLAGRRERGFSMAMDDLFAPGGVLSLALDRGGEPIAFLHLVPSPAGRGYSLSSQRRLPNSPGGVSEYLVVETLGWARETGVSEVSLNFCAFRSILHVGADGGLTHRLARMALLRLDSIFQIERLHSFSRKFRPEWRPRYVCLERIGDLPAVTVAYLRAESLIAPPRLPGRRRSGIASV